MTAEVLRSLLGPASETAARMIDAALAEPELRVAWYPSSGDDVRDFVELTPPRLQARGLRESPTLVVHTNVGVGDLAIPWLHEPFARTVGDARVESTEVAHAAIRPRYPIVEAHDAGLGTGSLAHATLARVRVHAPDAQVHEVTALGIPCTNYQFFAAFVLAGVAVHTLVNVREGTGCGGCSRSVAYLLPWLGAAGLKQCLRDSTALRTRRDIDSSTRAWVDAHPHELEPREYDVVATGRRAFGWSDLRVAAATVRVAR